MVRCGFFSRALDDLYTGNTARSPEIVAERLATKAKAAVDALSSFVIRHGIDDLPTRADVVRRACGLEYRRARGETRGAGTHVAHGPRASRGEGAMAHKSSKATNDPRFHVGWRHFDAVREHLKSKVPQFAEPARAVVENQLKSIKLLRDQVGIHSKMASRRRRGENHDRAGREGSSLLPPSCDGTGIDGAPRFRSYQPDNATMAEACLEESLESGA